ncbi:hypothetical protein OOK36_08260 [Streptomyces sp. NBC_00365]|uniref:hypothetical protein n=1 Tax=Streptomyces sp. NBC_00365 TaxID=2975726 RepID=UPI00225108F1|nr:hypothetical protein [Streptomyces sp. NBC_00365]MCX5088889.1 hypothetical protein [Streptomyces sp. NBC_00365]
MKHTYDREADRQSARSAGVAVIVSPTATGHPPELDLRGPTDQSLLVYTAQPHWPSAQALSFLAGWAATEIAARPTEAAGSSPCPGATTSPGESKDE